MTNSTKATTAQGMGTFDFMAVPDFARRYLQTYYTAVNEDEPIVAAFIREKLQPLTGLRLRALEVGCGPTLHHALAIAPYVETLDMADYLPGNLMQIELWRRGDSQAFDWHPYAEMVLGVEGVAPSQASIDARYHQLRDRLGELKRCDLTVAAPHPASLTYPLVCSFYCAEEIGTEEPAWHRIMSNIASLVAPGGHFLFAALRETSHYILETPEGDSEWLPCAHLTASHVLICMQELGFVPASIDVRSVDTPNLTPLGVPGILLGYGRRAPA